MLLQHDMIASDRQTEEREQAGMQKMHMENDPYYYYYYSFLASANQIDQQQA